MLPWKNARLRVRRMSVLSVSPGPAVWLGTSHSATLISLLLCERGAGRPHLAQLCCGANGVTSCKTLGKFSVDVWQHNLYPCHPPQPTSSVKSPPWPWPSLFPNQHCCSGDFSFISGFAVVCCVVTQPCPTLYYTMNCSPPGSFVHGISQATILE